MGVLLSELIKQKGTVILSPKMLLTLLQESNAIGKLQGIVSDMIVYTDDEGHVTYTLLPDNYMHN